MFAEKTEPEDISTMPFTSVIENTVGLPPGSPVYIGDKQAEEALFSIYCFDENSLTAETATDLKTICRYIDKSKVNWININGISEELIEAVCEYFDVNVLTMEDILNTKHRPKIDDFDDYVFFITKMLSVSGKKVKSEQVSFILKQNILITVQEENGDCFEPVRSRITAKNGRFRKKGADYLAYALFDVIVDNYFLALESIGAEIEKADTEIETKSNSRKNILYLQTLKSELSSLKRIIWPTREIINRASKLDSSSFSEYLAPYLRDLYENILQTLEAIDSYNEQIGNLIEYSLAMVNNRLSEIMKVLTIMSAIFIPLSFLAGLYGMNFKFMPELESRIAYPITLAVMFTIAVGELIYFKIKKWL